MNRDNELLSIGEAARMIGVSIDTLRRWDKNGQLHSFRPTLTSKRYYRRDDIEAFLPNHFLVLMRQWATSDIPFIPQPTHYCLTRDVFQARLEHFRIELERLGIDSTIMSLVTAIAGEIGNNSFDHNLGNWPDIPGIFFGYDIKKKQVALADRGQGVFKTLQRVKPHLKNHQQALSTAFTETLSGRAPESRGNGLKFVREIITYNPLRLTFQTGDAVLELRQNNSILNIKKTNTSFHGCMAVIYF